MSEESISQSIPPKSLEQVQETLSDLQLQLQFQKDELEALKERIPDSNIISQNFLKRAFTVWGHYVVAGFLVAIPFICLSMIFAILLALFSQQ
jgi:hypothetical protein